MRRWILQEVGVAQDSQFWCGHNSVSGYGLADAASFLLFEDSPVPITTPFMRVMSLKRPERYYASRKRGRSSESEVDETKELTEFEGLRAFGALERFREFECFDGRDRIASLAWVDGKRRLFSVGYDQSTEETFSKFAKTALKISMHCLASTLSSAARRPLSLDSIMSSWVPHWRIPREESEVQLRITSSKPRTTNVVRLLRQAETSSLRADVNDVVLRLSLEGFHECQAVVTKDLATVPRPDDIVIEFLEDNQMRFDVAGKLRAIVLRAQSERCWRFVAALDLTAKGRDAIEVGLKLDVL